MMKLLIPLFTFLLLLLAGCRGADNAPAAEAAQPVNAVYYWRTTFHPDSGEMAFLHRHNIGRIYLRMFDVEASNSAEFKAVPNATIQVPNEGFRLICDSLGDIEFTPVVYITDDAIRNITEQVDLTAENIVTRVKNMCSYNELPNVRELQLDCDWTATTEGTFFALCQAVRAQIEAQNLPWRLSSTIRLHQLRSTPPPVDSGVLMVYNTGAFNDVNTINSILHPDDVRSYVRHLRNYNLPLDVAYPTYGWQLLFRNNEFIGMTNGINVADTAHFRPYKRHVYEVKNRLFHNGRNLFTSDLVRMEESTPANILTVKSLIDKNIDNTRHSTILYHLDSGNLSKYTPDEIDSFYDSTAR